MNRRTLAKGVAWTAVKKCSSCGEVKSLGDFHRDRTKPDGHSPHCKTCKQAKQRARRSADPDKYNLRDRRWRAQNKQAVDDYNREYYRANRQREIDRSRRYKDANPEAVREARRAYLEANREAISERKALRRAANRHESWADGYRRRARRYGHEVVVEDFTRDDVIERYGDKCHYCEGDFEQLDHFIPVVAGGLHTLDNVRPSCARCDRAKWMTPGDKWMAGRLDGSAS